MKEEKLTLIGTIIEVLSGKKFRVSVDEKPDHIILAFPNNKLRGRGKRTRIQFVKADQVEMEVSTYDLSRGIITKRL